MIQFGVLRATVRPFDDQVLNVHFGYKRNFSQHAEWIRNYIDTTHLHPLPNYITVVESSVYFT